MRDGHRLGSPSQFPARLTRTHGSRRCEPCVAGAQNHGSSPAHRCICIRPPPTRIMSNEERKGAPIPQAASSPLQDAPILHRRHRGLRQSPGSERRFRFVFAGRAQSSTAGDLVPFMPMHSRRFPLVSHRHASTRGPRRRGGRRSRRL
jgi:hypothetical protein